MSRLKTETTPLMLGRKRTFWRTFGRDLRENHWLYIMCLPAIATLLVFCYLPMFGLIIAFQKMDYKVGIFGSPLVGLDNFKFLFSSSDAWVITRNTVAYNIVFIILGMTCSVLFALMISEMTNKLFTKTMQTIIMMPHFLSWAVVAIIVYAFLAPTYGFVTNYVKNFGIERINFYMKPSFWPPFLVSLNLWKGIGYSSVVYLAVITGISREFYEAAMIDGATKWQQAKYITIPHLRAMVSIMLIMSIGGIFRGDFGLFFLVPMDSGPLYPVTQIIDTYIYRGLTQLQNPNMTAAAGMYQSIVGFILVLISNVIVNKIDPDYDMF